VWEVVKAGYPARKLRVIGVTGTDGKTTTSHLIYEMLQKGGKKVALISTVAAYIGGEEIDTGFHVTTPDAKFLQPLIKRIVDQGMEYLVLETTSHGLDQHRVLGCNFWVGVVTNITHEHLDYHKTFERYRETKAKLIVNARYAVLNKQDASVDYLKSRARGEVVEYSSYEGKVSQVLDTDYNRQNLAAARAVAKIINVQDSIINKVAREFAGVVGRMEEIKLGQKFRAIVDFAHTPNALENVLNTLKKSLAKGHKLIVIFGCAGLRDHSKRPMMGEIATRLADKVVVTAEDPRTEDLGDIFGQIMSGVHDSKSNKVIREDDRQKAIELAVKLAEAGDIVVATGKGHEKSMCFGTREYPWSDQEAMKRAIRGEDDST
jgi:UDP-N-acetylmuramoyl-L-alanyl-D-glutamate--2,6-diaminopimelate ligase